MFLDYMYIVTFAKLQCCVITKIQLASAIYRTSFTNILLSDILIDLPFKAGKTSNWEMLLYCIAMTNVVKEVHSSFSNVNKQGIDSVTSEVSTSAISKLKIVMLK